MKGVRGIFRQKGGSGTGSSRGGGSLLSSDGGGADAAGGSHDHDASTGDHHHHHVGSSFLHAADPLRAVSAVSGAVTGAAGAVSGAVTGAAGAVGGAVTGAAGAVGGAVTGAAGAVGGAVTGAAGAVSGRINHIASFVPGARRGSTTRSAADGTTKTARPSYRVYDTTAANNSGNNTGGKNRGGGNKKRAGDDDDDSENEDEEDEDDESLDQDYEDDDGDDDHRSASDEEDEEQDDDPDRPKPMRSQNRAVADSTSKSPPDVSATGAGMTQSSVKAKNIESSAGTSRLNRILHSKNATGGASASVAMADDDPFNPYVVPPSAMVPGGGRGDKSGLNATGGSGMGGAPSSSMIMTATQIREKVSDPKDPTQVADFVARVVVPPLKVDIRSIGGHLLDGYPAEMVQEVLFCCSCQAFESGLGVGASGAGAGGAGGHHHPAETVQMSALQFPGEYIQHKRSLGLLGGTKGRHKLRYVLIARSTNRPLVEKSTSTPHNSPLHSKGTAHAYPHQIQRQQQQQKQHHSKLKKASNQGGDDESERADYDAMYSQDESMSKDIMSETDGSESHHHESANPLIVKNNNTNNDGSNSNLADVGAFVVASDSAAAGPATLSILPADEVSSFPVLVCMTLHSDGTAPDIRKLCSLVNLTTVQDLHSTTVQLAFSNGETLRIDFGTMEDGGDEDKIVESTLEKERFIWSLLQIHAMLCTAVVERNSVNIRAQHTMTSSAAAASTTASSTSGSAAAAAASGAAGTASAAAAAAAATKDQVFLPPLNIRNMDRAELQYVATVNGFIQEQDTICAMLDRHRLWVSSSADGVALMGSADEGKMGDMEDYDEMAYNLIMGNFATRMTLFQTDEERKDAEEVLNAVDDWIAQAPAMIGGLTKDDLSALSIAERLEFTLQWRMRDLEAETCRRLIAWEDEKHLSSTGKSTKLHGRTDERDSVDALALASLFKTLDSLDVELKAMEDWLQERAAAIKPLTDDCADIEEENRQLEQQWKSYDMLGTEMKRLLQGLVIDKDMEKLLDNPATALVYDDDGGVDVDRSESGVEQIYQAGKALQEALEYPRRSGGLHLIAVSERTESLQSIANKFCNAVAQIIVTVMEQFKTMVVAGSDHGKVSKADTHSMIAKKIRDTQRKFQSALLGYIKLIEVVAALSPEMLPALRDAYAELVAEGILMKKRMKGYFQALPGKNTAYLYKVGKDLKDYTGQEDPAKMDKVNAPDIRAALGDLLPIVAREAYFTSALFGTTKVDSDGREKKRNFENTKSAVDNASVNLRYYLNRTCGILGPEYEHRFVASDGTLRFDPLLCLVASIYLNEAMDNYIDREKKGGDHSLSLAYIRATILDYRKKADKQWVEWVDRQIEWVKSLDGVPLSGKRAGVFPSFARFPSYLDHLVTCCKEGREDGYFPDLQNIKVITYYLQKLAATLLDALKECANRETTDRLYAANVMQMENTYFFTQSIKERGPQIEALFSKQTTKANAICKESTDNYLGWMIKKEFTELHELFSKASKIRKDVGDREVVKHIPKAQFVSKLQKEASREVLKEKIATIYSRMEKHLSEDGRLLPVAWKALVKVLYEWFGRWEKLSTAVYSHKLQPTAVDVVRIAKAAGGGASKSKDNGGGSGTDFGFKSILALKAGSGSVATTTTGGTNP